MADKYEYYISTDAKKQILHYGVNTDDPNTKFEVPPGGNRYTAGSCRRLIFVQELLECHGL